MLNFQWKNGNDFQVPINFTFFTRNKVNLHQLATDTAMFFGVR